jgi:cytoskeletal protein RodZ
MTTSTIVWIVVVVVAAALLVAAIAWVARKKRTEHRRVQAGDIREKAVEQSHEVGQREALADETAAKARAAQAEAEAMAAHSKGLQHQAQTRRTDAATSRSELNRQFERADKIDPDSDASATAQDDSEARDTPRGTRADEQGQPPMPRAG